MREQKRVLAIARAAGHPVNGATTVDQLRMILGLKPSIDKPREVDGSGGWGNGGRKSASLPVK